MTGDNDSTILALEVLYHEKTLPLDAKKKKKAGFVRDNQKKAEPNGKGGKITKSASGRVLGSVRDHA